MVFTREDKLVGLSTTISGTDLDEYMAYTNIQRLNKINNLSKLILKLEFKKIER